MAACHNHFVPTNLTSLSDSQLIDEVERLVQDDRRLTARLLVHLAEVDTRKLYLKHACPSMHVYCVQRLGMSDPEAYFRIHAARTASRHPRIFDMVAQNELHLTGIALLSQHLTGDNCDDLLDAAVGKSKREIEQLLADWFPKPDAPAMVRRLPRPAAQDPNDSQLTLARASHRAEARGPRTGSQRSPTQQPKSVRARVEPTAPERYKIQLTASAALYDKLREAQALLRHQVPTGDIAEIFERALDLLLKDTKKKKYGATDRPRESVPPPTKRSRRSRHIPNAVKRAVVERDGGQCTFVDADGNRCQATSLIEFHHLEAFARGGAHTVANTTLRCAPHNRLAAEEELGREVVAAKIRAARDVRNRNRSTPSGESHTAPSGESCTVTQLLTPSKLRERRLPAHVLYAVTRRAAALPGGERCDAAPRREGISSPRRSRARLKTEMQVARPRVGREFEIG